MDFKRAPFIHVILVIIELTFAANIILIDILVFKTLTNETKPTAESTHTAADNTTSSSQQLQTVASPTGLISNITPTSGLISPTVVPQTQIIVSPVKEFFIPLGSGQGSGTDWTDVPGLQASLDPGSYPNVKQVVLEVSAQTPTGNQTASIRLFNKTAQHPVWFSDVSLSGGDAKLLVSQPITLDTGNNTYQVQMRTQLGYQTNVLQSRIHITLQ